jgi:ABC transporter DrrB family efflux protein
MTAVASTFSDTLVLARRNLMRIPRQPDLLIAYTIQPVMFVLLFVYVFGGAIQVPGGRYADFLLPGIFVQAVVFGSAQTGIGLADDLSRGMVDRFRSLPMARSAVLAGRTLADLVRNVFVILLMAVVGYLVGFRFQAGVLRALAAVCLVALLGYAFSWISAAVGLLARDPESAQAAGFVWLFPLVFASSIFVPVETMPSWLASFARVSPMTAAADAARALSLGGPAGTPALRTLLWVAVILAVFVPLAVTRYRRAT